MRKSFPAALLFYSLLLGGSLFARSSNKGAEVRPLKSPQIQDVNDQYKLCVCSIFKNEAPYMREWIEYYKLLGVEHFRLYNNDSTDNYKQVLAPYIESGDVTLVDWPTDLSNPKRKAGWVWFTQRPALADAISYFAGISKWLAIIDLDEFIVPLHQNDLPSFLEEYESEAGVLINWQNFGTSGIQDIPPGKLMIEVLTKRAKEKSSYNYPVKSIVRPERIDIKGKCWCPHTWDYISGYGWILPNHEKWRFGQIDLSKARINHYVHRSERYFYEVKVASKERMEGKKLKKKYIQDWKKSCNRVEDTEIFRFVPALRERILLSNDS